MSLADVKMDTKITDKIINEEIKQVSKTNLKPIKYGFFQIWVDICDKESYLLYSLEDLYR